MRLAGHGIAHHFRSSHHHLPQARPSETQGRAEALRPAAPDRDPGLGGQAAQLTL